MPQVAATSTLDAEARLDLDNMAVAMYAERQADDAKAGRAEIYERNPDAQTLYDKGVHDVIKALFIWMDMCSPNLGLYLEKLHEQTADEVTTVH
jgi:hypothetical protein